MKFKAISVRAKESFGEVSVTIEIEEGEDEELAFDKAERFIAAKLTLMGNRQMRDIERIRQEAERMRQEEAQEKFRQYRLAAGVGSHSSYPVPRAVNILPHVHPGSNTVCNCSAPLARDPLTVAVDDEYLSEKLKRVLGLKK